MKSFASFFNPQMQFDKTVLFEYLWSRNDFVWLLYHRFDKTRNIYEMKPDQYKQLWTENVTANYKLGNEKLLEEINQELKTVARDLHVDDRIETMARKPAFISLKVHNENFENNTKCHLINPAKSDLGNVSKVILDRINTSIPARTGVDQWRLSTVVNEWSSKISEKYWHTFISFNIVDFYPSISEHLVDRAISWSQQLTTITPQEEAIIKHARKSFYSTERSHGSDEKVEKMFDVTMGSNDGAEVLRARRPIRLRFLIKKIRKDKHGTLQRRRTNFTEERHSQTSRESYERFNQGLRRIWAQDSSHSQPKNCLLPWHDPKLTKRQIPTLQETKRWHAIHQQAVQPPASHYEIDSEIRKPKSFETIIRLRHLHQSCTYVQRRT